MPESGTPPNTYKKYGSLRAGSGSAKLGQAMNLDDMKGALPQKKNKEKNKTQNPLSTIWGEQLDPLHVWEEYPRPRMVRGNVQIWNGFWNYAFTDSPEYPSKFDGKILVPFSPESPLSGVGRRLEPNEYLWYERVITPASCHKKERCLLHFEAIDQSAVVYVDHQEVISHSGGYLPFEVDITQYLEGKKELLLSVRVRDLTDTSYESRGKQKLEPGGMYYTAQSGIWQSVWSEIVPTHYLTDLLFLVDPDEQSVTLQLRDNLSHGSHPPFSVNVQIFAPTLCLADQDVADVSRASVILEKKASYQKITNCSLSFKLREPQLWSPIKPWLYPVRVQMDEDVVCSYFAVRSFTLGTDDKGISRIFLNHKPIFLNGVLDQGYWPDGLYTAPCDEALVYDITEMKRLGFNMLRKHAKIENRRWYYHCDRLGMIVWQDMVNGGGQYSALLLTYLPTGVCVPGPLMKRNSAPYTSKGHPGLWQKLEYRITGRKDADSRAQFRREVDETIDLLRGYPSVMTWVLFNEGWGQFDTKELVDFVKRKDPGHLVDAASGWFEHKTGDFKSVHNYFRKLTVYRDIRAQVLSEYGGYVYHIEEHSSFESTYGYHTCESGAELEEGLLDLLTEQVLPLAKKGLCGAVYTQVSDIEEETNGLMTYDRKITKLSESCAKKLRAAFEGQTSS